MTITFMIIQAVITITPVKYIHEDTKLRTHVQYRILTIITRHNKDHVYE